MAPSLSLLPFCLCSLAMRLMRSFGLVLVGAVSCSSFLVAPRMPTSTVR
jgi:hypothetical protein